MGNRVPRYVVATCVFLLCFPAIAMRREEKLRQPLSASRDNSVNTSQVSLHTPRAEKKVAQNGTQLAASKLPFKWKWFVTDTKLLTIFDDVVQHSDLILIWVFILLALALIIFIQLSGWPAAKAFPKPKYGSHAQEVLLQDFEQLARRLRGKVQKYSASCKQSHFGSPVLRDRFVSVVPVSSTEGEGRCVQDWLKAELRWWESESFFNEGLPPRGSVVLETIMNFFQEPEHQEHQGRRSILKSRNGEDLCELSLVFPTPQASSEFCNALWEFFQKMQEAESSAKVQEPL